MSNDVAPIAPHGGTLVNLQVAGSDADALADEAANIPRVTISERELSDLEMLATGALSPLTGFQTEDDYHARVPMQRLSRSFASRSGSNATSRRRPSPSTGRMTPSTPA